MDLVSSLNHDLHHQKQWTVHKRHKYNSFALTSCNGQLDGFQGPIVAGQGSITRTDSTIHLGEQLWSVLQIIKRWAYRLSKLTLQVSKSFLRAANSLANPLFRVSDLSGDVQVVYLHPNSEFIFSAQ